MSSSDLAIRISNLSKRFEIYETPRDRLKQFVIPGVRRLLGRPYKQYFREFWALRDISFEVKKGETVGIIGRNGAGKSTLLQILCGTLSPSSGSVEISGRVAALLELGSGFNPDFTGRENIYMNAGVLGLSRDQIDRRFNEIVAFADIGDFLDQPVRTYSSGMYVRLAFAVVVHVDADILVVDEALSVGDMYFQAKCMSHMKKLIASGVTVLFVSHDVNAVKALCGRAVYLEHGDIMAVGATDEVVDAYYSAGVKGSQALRQAPETIQNEAARELNSADLEGQLQFAARASFHRIQNGMAEWMNIMLLDDSGQRTETVDFGQTVVLKMVFRSNVDVLSIGVAYHIRDRNGFDVIYSDTGIEKCHATNVRAGEIVVVSWVFTVNLREGDYTVAAMLSIPQDLSIGKAEVCDFVPLAVSFKVARGRSLPIYGAAYWTNKVSQQRYSSRGVGNE